MVLAFPGVARASQKIASFLAPFPQLQQVAPLIEQAAGFRKTGPLLEQNPFRSSGPISGGFNTPTLPFGLDSAPSWGMLTNNPFSGRSASQQVAASGFSQWRDMVYGGLKKQDPMGDHSSSASPGDASKAVRLEGTHQWDSLIKQVANETNVPWQVIQAIMGIESGGDPNAGSVQGAAGLMQIMPEWWKPGENRFDPYTNIKRGAEILSKAYQQYGDWTLAAKTYLAGNPYSTARDANGTGVNEYGQMFNDNLAALGWGASAGGRTTDQGLFSTILGGNYDLTQTYGHTDFAHSSGGYADDFHDGVDFGVPSGTSLYAPMGGMVVFSGWQKGYGNTVMVRLDNGYTLQLSHLSALPLSYGTKVSGGSVIGISGSTGWSTGPHVHIRLVDPSGKSVDPSRYYH